MTDAQKQELHADLREVRKAVGECHKIGFKYIKGSIRHGQRLTKEEKHRDDSNI